MLRSLSDNADLVGGSVLAGSATTMSDDRSVTEDSRFQARHRNESQRGQPVVEEAEHQGAGRPNSEDEKAVPMPDSGAEDPVSSGRARPRHHLCRDRAPRLFADRTDVLSKPQKVPSRPGRPAA